MLGTKTLTGVGALALARAYWPAGIGLLVLGWGGPHYGPGAASAANPATARATSDP